MVGKPVTSKGNNENKMETVAALSEALFDGCRIGQHNLEKQLHWNAFVCVSYVKRSAIQPFTAVV